MCRAGARRSQIRSKTIVVRGEKLLALYPLAPISSLRATCVKTKSPVEISNRALISFRQLLNNGSAMV